MFNVVTKTFLQNFSFNLCFIKPPFFPLLLAELFYLLQPVVCNVCKRHVTLIVCFSQLSTKMYSHCLFKPVVCKKHVLSLSVSASCLQKTRNSHCLLHPVVLKKHKLSLPASASCLQKHVSLIVCFS